MMAVRKKKSMLASPAVIVGLAVCVVATVSFFRGRSAPGDWIEPAARKPASEMEWSVRDHSTWRLSEQRGKAVVVNYFATWCPPCVSEMPDLVKVIREMGPKGVTALAVSMDQGDDKTVAAFIERHAITFPVAMGAGDIRTATIEAIPVTAVFDKQGRLAVTFTGMVTEPELRRVLDKLVSE